MALPANFEGVQPTRLELLRLRRRRLMAQGIVENLRKELLALTLRLFHLVQEGRALRVQVDGSLERAYDLFVQAEMISGERSIEENSLASQPLDFDVIMSIKRDEKLGISLSSFKLTEAVFGPKRPRYGITDTPASLDESVLGIRTVLNHIVRLAEVEASIVVLLEGISKRQRRLNRIQHRVLPQLDDAIRRIELVLEETERQDAIRVRVLQSKRKEWAQSRAEISIS